MKEVYAIFAIVLISAFVFVTSAPSTGNLAANYYGVAKVYGGAQKKVYQRPNMVGQAFAKQLQQQRWQNFMYSQPENWDCSFGERRARASADPCIQDEESGKWCCIDVNSTVNLNNYNTL